MDIFVKNILLMKRISLLLLLLLSVSDIFAQNTTDTKPLTDSLTGFPLPEEMTPGMTEFWLPQPPQVTPGDAGSAPSDAIVLFDGTDLDAWRPESNFWTIENGLLKMPKKGSALATKENFGSVQMHIEWMVPAPEDGKECRQGNSGVFFQGRYELQILDMNGGKPTYANGMCGSIYKQQAPLANPMRGRGEWNEYDIIYNAPVFNSNGSYRVPPTITVIFNGVLVLNNAQIFGTTTYIGLPKVQPHGDAPIMLQRYSDTEDTVYFRNIWVRKL